MTEPRTYTQEEFDAMVTERDAVKANRDEVLREAKASKKKLVDYDGVDPEKYKALVKAAEDAETQRLAGEGDWKAIVKQPAVPVPSVIPRLPSL